MNNLAPLPLALPAPAWHTACHSRTPQWAALIDRMAALTHAELVDLMVLQERFIAMRGNHTQAFLDGLKVERIIEQEMVTRFRVQHGSAEYFDRLLDLEISRLTTGRAA